MSDEARTVGSTVRRALRKARSMADRGAPPEPPAEAATSPSGKPAKKTGRPPGQRAGVPEVDPRFVRSFWRVGRNLLGYDAFPESHEGMSFDNDLATRLATRSRKAQALATFGEMVSNGESVEAAHAATVRIMVVNQQLRHDARSFTLGLESLPQGRTIRHIGLGLVTHGLGLYELAWAQFADLEPAVLAELAPVEAVHCALADGSPEAVEAARQVAAHPTLLGGEDLVEVAARFQSMGEPELARALVEEASTRDASEYDAHHAAMLENLRYWTHPEPAPEPEVPGGVSIGVFDYYSPDYERASRNVGDYVQTLAMLGNLARFRGTRFHGPDGLGELMTELQGRVRDELHVDGGEADVNLLAVSRDYSEGDPIPPDTWAVAFGWHMHPLFRLRFGMPYHENINPIFVSFHLNRVPLLTDDAIAYLKAHGPIGCRDWTTVDLLLSAGVDAFFTGCLTTTVNAVFPDTDAVEKDDDRVVAIIDLPPSAARKVKRRVEFFSHGDYAYRSAGLVEGTRGASDLLAGYQRRYHRILTSRLHSYLPATSLGVPVTFRPHIPGDVRFEGLYGMKPGLPAFEDMRDGIRHLIKETFGRVLDGADKDAVYAHWRELTAPLVAQARARFEQPARELPLTFDLDETVARINASRRLFGPEADASSLTDIAVSTDANFRHHLPVTLESIVSNASGPLRVWVTGRGLDEDYQQWLSDAFPELPLVFLSFDDVDYGVVGRMIKHITVATMDRLLLPEVLAELDRITYVDIDTVTEGDVCELARTDLQGLPLAARTSVYSGALLWRQAGDLLAPEAAAELRRTLSARHPFDFRTFNAGVLVLDLARMRKDGFTRTFVPMAGEFGLNDQDILNAYVGADRVELEPKWNALPVQEKVVEPGIVHFAGGGKPWDAQLTPYAEHWHRYAEQFSTHAPTPAP